ncbi:type VI secretion system protein TssA [Pantoea phytobeneficialis]|uniref:Type VI secretion system protein TssA n=1 Tax=Pantoea phytobeneficialis TaxID=2052056 RepID=A0AAP9H7F9_9GAMM|nr:type VI secretion system protein TssA [Pantoea phytobeneficialis]MDO6410079.1 type VI secretion system protein TssA [Pantoea phytobeneficialis]QGR08130.1 type VI secretion system protein TssA [Pantoea phytobeneficialis]
MTGIAVLISACGAEESALRAEAQQHISDWARWMEPIADRSPTGEDPAYDDHFQQMREEVNKLSGVDTALIIALAEPLLLSVSKDIRVITFYLWARLHQQGEQGLAEGLELLAASLQQYGELLHPQRPRSRQGALSWLGSGRMLDSLALWPEVDRVRIRRVCAGLLRIHDLLSAEERPVLAPLVQALEVRLARSGGADVLVPQNCRESSDVDAHQHITASIVAPVCSGRDLLDQARSLARYLRDQPEGWLAAHHLMKSVRWDTLHHLPPLDASGRTRLSPPKPEHLAHLKRLWLQQSWQELLELTDSLFAQGVNHLWLDVQWYVWEALNRGKADSRLATLVEQDLGALLLRLPGLEGLTFSDGMPFADEVTLNWIARQVSNDASYREPVAVACGGEQEGDILALESDALAKADEEGVEAALNWLQQRPGVNSPRARWLLRLLMARVCEQLGKNDMALHLLRELDSQAENLTLAHWSPEFMFEVRARRLKLLRTRAARSENDKARLQSEMNSLLAGLITIDPARAAVLCG